MALDWPGHGESEAPAGDFGMERLVESAQAVIEASGAPQVVPVAMSHAGWVAIELRRRLKERISKLVLLDWLVLEAPALFLDALRGMQSPERWRETVDHIFLTWLHGATNNELVRFVRGVMGAFGYGMWARAAREITASYARAGSPLQALAGLKPPVPVLHLYSQPDDARYLGAQHSFAAEHPWFQVRKLAARSHIPLFEVPEEMATAIEEFTG
jgi:pimeloyl-ACP methyl ester carboxylesterase